MQDFKSVIFLVPYPIGNAPSQRFRVEQFFPLLERNNIRYKVSAFLDIKTWRVLYKGGSVFDKALGITKGYLRRWVAVLFQVPRYDIVFIHREAAPLGPPVFEWIIAKLYRKKVIYDFDDAIWIPNTSTQNRIANYFKAFWKVGKICKWAHITAAGNQHLADFAKKNHAQNVIYLPTVVDTHSRYNHSKNHEGFKKPVIGWTGSHSTIKYLKIIESVINKLQELHDFTFLVIADKNPELNIKDYKFIEWNETNEISDLLKIDIGVMPLVNDEWSEGKCGFKLIQYMALGIPAVASPVGVNKKIILNGINSYLTENNEQWLSHLQSLLIDISLRRKMGKLAKEQIERQFSIQSVAEKFIGLFL